MAGFPLVVGHAINPLLCLVHGDFEPAAFGRSLVPFGETIPAEVSEDHEIDVLHFGVYRKVIEKSTKNCGVEPVLICNVEVFVVCHVLICIQI